MITMFNQQRQLLSTATLHFPFDSQKIIRIEHTVIIFIVNKIQCIIRIVYKSKLIAFTIIFVCWKAENYLLLDYKQVIMRDVL